MNDFRERIANLSPAKRALMELRLGKAGLQITKGQRVHQGQAPLSFAQQRIWFLDQLEPGSASYNVPRAIRLTGRLKVKVLRQTLEEIVQRHESLRTTFMAVDGAPVQVIGNTTQVEMPVIDISELSEREREAEAKELIRQEARQPFDLAAGPIFRTKLVKLSQDEHILLMTMHHIISDGWSKGVLFREIGALYDAFSDGQVSPLAELPIQYSDYALWQREWMQGEVLQKHLSYWKDQLTDAQAALELPTDRPRPAVQSNRGATFRMMLSQNLSQELRALSRREGVTVFMTLLAAFNTLLWRYTGQKDMVVGSLIANRNRIETEGLIGIFINALPLRADLSGNPTFRELLRRTSEVALGAYAHQDLPFEKLVEAIQPERDLSRSPLFQVMFNVQNTPKKTLELTGLTLTPLVVDGQTSLLDLTLTMSDGEDGLKGTVEYSTDLFDEPTISRMMGHYQTLLEGIATKPEQRLSELPLLTDREQHQFAEWNNSEREYPLGQCFHQLFEAQVERTPEALAVVSKEERLTYLELNRRANRLALFLVTQGVGPDVIVTLLADRSVEFLTAILAVFKAGGAYLPLDPLHPAVRIRQVIEQSGTNIVLTTSQFASTLSQALAQIPTTERPQVFRLEEVSTQVQEDNNLPLRCAPRHLAYVIFTSGSTGLPKGAMVEHVGMLNHLLAKIDDLQLSKSDVLAQTASQCFDISVWQFLAALIVGGRVHIFEDEISHDPIRLHEQIDQKGITIIEVVPSLLRVMLEQAKDKPTDLSSLRWMIVTGEAVPPKLVDDWLNSYSEIPLLNAYGPTECSDDVTHYVIEQPGFAADSQVPIGRPISNTRIYISDSRLSPIPINVVGELFIGGVGVGRGYLNDATRTAEVFVPDPFSQEPGARLYKTGDLARYLPDGNIEFLGRIDHQVKVRGFRIELGEIEAVINQHPMVHETVVLAREDKPGDKRLVAYLVTDQKSASSPIELRSQLRERLPDYMIPSAFVVLDRLPLTPNGKVDRRALPIPEQSSPEHDETHVAPRTPVQEMLVAIWGEVLNIKSVGTDENFFELGGHSLLIVQLISRVRSALGVDLSLRVLFESPTVGELAQRVEAALRAEQFEQQPPLGRTARNAPLPLSFAQQRLWFLDQLEPASASYNVPRAMRLKGYLNFEVLRQALEEIVRRHDSLRTTFIAVDGKPAQVIAGGTEVQIPMIDLSQLSESVREAEADELSRQEVTRTFDLARGPLFRVRILKLREDEHVLLLTMHHIICDGWSLAVLFEELGALYEAYSKGQASPLPELPIQYADYAAWQREWLTGNVLDKQLRYWKKQLTGAPALLELPIDRPRPVVQSYRGARQHLTLTQDLSDKISELSRREGVTLFMTLFAAFQVLLYHYSGKEDIVVGTPIAGRNLKETEGLIGVFINTLILRSDLSGEPSFRDLLRQVRDTALNAYANQDLPFERLLDHLQVKRDLSYNALFQVWFVLHSTVRRQKLELPSLKIDSLHVDTETTRHDLQLSVWEAPTGLKMSFDYNKSLFNASTINVMVRHFEALLLSIVTEPGAQLCRLKEMSNTVDKQQQIVVERQLEEASLQRLKRVKRRVVSGSQSRGETNNGTYRGGVSATTEDRTIAETSRLDGDPESIH